MIDECICVESHVPKRLDRYGPAKLLSFDQLDSRAQCFGLGSMCLSLPQPLDLGRQQGRELVARHVGRAVNPLAICRVGFIVLGISVHGHDGSTVNAKQPRGSAMRVGRKG